ncbi:TonB family protein [Pseudenhygromyxa sp. WMMC2535]|uniref:energy transducer TonB n=1 Tax=Pseudenhygromyxa sp. WMMC2535 TaxID=2712867 RepID=UPI001551BBA6|nr:TonB family protein [Pseudenhygromyxa sp. WMMC2535]NVB40154.1 TonB family protein [Pseudenhygromyxa sp. WMMC2535]
MAPRRQSRVEALALLVGAAGLAFGLGACRPAGDPQAPLRGELELCCKEGGEDGSEFRGCRSEGRCRIAEPIWVRGPLRCGPIDESSCAGGRCCTLDVVVNGAAQVERDAGEQGEDEAPPAARAPAAITPVPLDWRAEPTPVLVPKYVCPVSVERGLVGEVVLHVEVAADGRVSEVEVRQGLDPECDTLARDALLHAEFEPARSPEGEAIAASLRWVYRFER